MRGIGGDYGKYNKNIITMTKVAKVTRDTKKGAENLDSVLVTYMRKITKRETVLMKCIKNNYCYKTVSLFGIIYMDYEIKTKQRLLR